MRIKFLLFFYFITISFCQAQRFDGGVLLGFSASQIDGDSYYGFYKVGLLGGAWINTKFDEKFSGQFEIKYIGKGSAPYKDIINPTFYRIRLQYIEMPVLAQYNVYEIITLEAGASVGYLIKEQYDPDGNGYYVPDGEPKRFELATQVGINIKFAKKISFNIRHSYSVLPFRESNYVALPNFSTGGLFNHVASVALYYRIGQN